MPKRAYDIFALGIKFLGPDQQSKHIAIGLFKSFNTFGHALDITKLLGKYDLRKKIIVYVKNEGDNLNTMTITLKSTISCDVLGLTQKNQGSYFGHAFSKVC